KAKFGLELVLAHLEDSTRAALPFAACIGVAAGAGGALYLLTEAIAAGVDDRRITRLFARGEETLLTCRDTSPRDYSWWKDQLGTAAVCLGPCARATSRELARWAAEVVEECLASAPEESEIHDVSLVKGTAGTAHLWHRIYRAGGDSRCLAASLLGWERAIES